MKKLFILTLTLISLSAKSETVTSTIKSSTITTTISTSNTLSSTISSIGDTIIIPIGAIQIEPIIVSVQGDSARSISWSALQLSRDTTTGFTAYVMIFDKNGKGITQINQEIPVDIARQWGYDPTPIDDYILLMNPRFKRVNKK